MPVHFTAQDVCVATGGTLVSGPGDAVFTSVAIDSRAVAPGALFVPLPGNRVDGHAYIPEAVRQGARGFLFARDMTLSFPEGAVGTAVRDPLLALQDLAAWWRNRLHALVIGIA